MIIRRLPLVQCASGHLSRVVRNLLQSGWKVERVPEDARVPRNGLKLILTAGGQETKLRVFAYKVTTSGRNRPHERRIEITTTYASGLPKARGFRDVVLGVDAETGNYVGVDARRLRMGGSTHNASSFFDLEGLSVRPRELLVNPRAVSSSLFPNGTEQHCFFDGSRLSEYLLNHQEIHLGRYGFQGQFGGPLRLRPIAWPNKDVLHPAAGECLVLSSGAPRRRSVPRLSANLVTAVAERDFTGLGRRTITPAQLKEIQRVCDEIGVLGEQFVLAEERKRLTRKGFKAQAGKVERVSLRSVGEGYDILSYEDDGETSRYVEVKTTTGRGQIVDVSRTEWASARRHRDHYYLARVTDVRADPRVFYIRNPADLELKGLVVKTPSGWRVDLRAVMGERG